MLEKHEECPHCGEASGEWRYDGQYCAACGYPNDPAGHVLTDIAAERDRQRCQEGFDAAHDDQHDGGELVLAACAYAFAAQMPELTREVVMPENGGVVHSETLRELWPWAHEWWKPSDRRRDLVKAGALIVAEIERLDRAAKANRP